MQGDLPHTEHTVRKKGSRALGLTLALGINGRPGLAEAGLAYSAQTAASPALPYCPGGDHLWEVYTLKEFAETSPGGPKNY